MKREATASAQQSTPQAAKKETAAVGGQSGGGTGSAKRGRDTGATPSPVVSRPAKAARVAEQGEISVVAGKAVATAGSGSGSGSGGGGGGGVGSSAAATEVCGEDGRCSSSMLTLACLLL